MPGPDSSAAQSPALAAGPWQSIAAQPTPRATLVPPADERVAALRQWLGGLDSALGLDVATLRIASADASFRRYFRLDGRSSESGAHTTMIAMDAPPPQEDTRPFLQAQSLMAQTGLRVPGIMASDPDTGFILLEDFGDLTLLEALRADPTGQWLQSRYRGAIAALVRLQAASGSTTTELPTYDGELLLRELSLYPDWYVAKHKGIILNPQEVAQLRTGFARLVDGALAQTQVTVHRDWHSRNLMVLDTGFEPGVLDFQDAVHGPLTYDLVSLLRDAYVTWDDERVLDWAIRYWEQARQAGIAVPEDFGVFWRDFEWMGIQRHLKVLGIFARLHLRDGKERYLADLPRVLDYVTKAVHRYDALAPLARIIDRVENRTPTSGFTF
ncbi:MAG: aminoglycoside phosphotransferase [Betaproteobacteria bacterium]|nr:aminoglycoside phosphotransferase [Betaproteobacteria bacterium]NBY18595.1 aminoglycoside phosphotransferase [Betaproteobacteria bacterium]